MRNKVKNVSINKLNILKSHILKRFKVKDKSLLQRTKRLWNEIKTGNDITTNYNNVKEYIHNLHKEDLLSFFDDVFIVNKGKLSVQIYNNSLTLQNESNINDKDKYIIISDTNYFRNLNHAVM
jgi:secreted Zn-dependent insulinase-like peptidase